jgi:pimeloyl-ACP methyl ester carboxylesterase
VTEEVATFGCSQSLVGILTNPPLTTLRKLSPGVIILGAGMVHRVGPNRLSVKIARVLGQLGFTTLRFDFSGVGDSFVRKDHLPYHKSVILEAQEAMDFVHSAKGIQRFILLGICTGAMNSFEIARRDPRVQGIFLINPAGGFDRSARAELADYFGKRKKAQGIRKGKIFNPKNWWRAITGQIDYTNLKGILSFQGKRLLFGQKRFLPNTESAFDTLFQLTQKGVNVQFVISGEDPQVKNYFGALLMDKISKRRFAGKVLIDVIKQADHTFTSLSSQPELFQVIQNFALKCSSQKNPSGQTQGEAISVHHEEANFLTKNIVTSPRVHER